MSGPAGLVISAAALSLLAFACYRRRCNKETEELLNVLKCLIRHCGPDHRLVENYVSLYKNNRKFLRLAEKERALSEAQPPLFRN
jgi:hypothetical protein